MHILNPLAEFGYYLVLSLLVGHVVFQFVPEKRKPKLLVSKRVLLFSALAIIFLSFTPIFQAILFFNETNGFLSAAATVLTSFKIGHVWIFTTVFVIFLWLTIYLDRSKYLQAFWALLLVLAVGYGSHVSSQSIVVGLFSHTVHFLMVTIWVGVLLHTAWLSKNRDNWQEFLHWFTPLAIVCMLSIFATGFFIMFTIEKPTEYLNGWATPYGRMLLFKHISIIPVIIFAIINGILSKQRTQLSAFDPRPWLKAESVIIGFVFFFTGVMGTLSPPNEFVYSGTSNSELLTWVDWLLAKNLLFSIQIEFAPTFLSIMLITIALLFLLLIIFSYKQMRPVYATLFGGCFILTLYLGLMFSCVIYQVTYP